MRCMHFWALVASRVEVRHGATVEGGRYECKASRGETGGLWVLHGSGAGITEGVRVASQREREGIGTGDQGRAWGQEHQRIIVGWNLGVALCREERTGVCIAKSERKIHSITAAQEQGGAGSTGLHSQSACHVAATDGNSQRSVRCLRTWRRGGRVALHSCSASNWAAAAPRSAGRATAQRSLPRTAHRQPPTRHRPPGQPPAPPSRPPGLPPVQGSPSGQLPSHPGCRGPAAPPRAPAAPARPSGAPAAPPRGPPPGPVRPRPRGGRR